MPDRDFDVGKMRHRVTLQVPGTASVRSNPATGKPDVPWATVGTFWARLEPLEGRELVNARQLKASISHKVTMRVVAPIPPTGRFIFPGVESPSDPLDVSGRRVFNIAAPPAREDEVDGYYKILTESTP